MYNFFKVGVLGCAVMLTACTSFDLANITQDYNKPVPTKPVKLPYNFFIGDVIDMRPKNVEPRLIDHLSKRKQYPFQEDVFSKALVKNVNGRTLYDYEDATLRVELLDYAAFREQFHYTLSFYLDVTGLNEQGKVLATGKFSCMKERNEAVALLDKVKGVLKHDQDRQQYNKAQEAEVWSSLYKECLMDVAREFNNKVRLWGRG